MAEAPVRARFTPDRTALAAVLVLALGGVPLALSSVLLLWVFLLPLAVLVWVLRARVVAVPVGIEVCNGLRVRRVRWTEVEGIDVGDRGRVRLLLAGGERLALTAMTRRDVPRLVAVGQAAATGS